MARKSLVTKFLFKVATIAISASKHLTGGMPFSLRQVITVHLELNEEVSPEKRKIGICFSASPFGKLKFEVEDNVTSPTNR